MARRPLSRPMFRVPGASRQPAGILASSPQLMQAAQRNMGAQDLYQPAVVQGPLTGVGPDMFGVQPRQVSAVTAPPATVTPAALPPSYDDTAVMDQVAGSLGSDVLPEPKPTPPMKSDQFGDIDERSEATLDRMVGSANNLRTATDNILKGVPSRDDAILGGKSVNELYADVEEKMGRDAPSLKDYNLADFEDLAMQSLGYKEGELGPSEVADKDRRTSFWLSLIKAGLATAAGESPYLLTNLAKGLSFGVESFGKDLGDINQREREDNRAIASAKMDLLKDQRSVDTANRAAEIQAATMKVQLAESIRGEAREDAFRQIDMAVNFQKMENDLFRYVNDENRAWAEIDFNKDKFDKTLQATIAGQQPEVIRGMLVAPGYMEAAKEGVEIDPMDPSTYRMTAAGEALFKAWIKGKGTTRLTNLAQAADAAAKKQAVMGLDFSHLDNGEELARDAALEIGALANIPSSIDDRPAALIPIARATGARTSDAKMIDYVVLEGNTAGIDFYDSNNQKIDIANMSEDDIINRTAYIEFGRPGSRVLATREDDEG